MAAEAAKLQWAARARRAYPTLLNEGLMLPSRVIDADFFREFFITFVGEYAEHRGLQRNPNDVQVSVIADGTEMLVLGWRAGPGWIVLFTEDDYMHTIPYETITKVSVHRRSSPLPAPPPRPPVGFAALDLPPAE